MCNGMLGASSLAPALAGFCGAPLAEFVGAVDIPNCIESESGPEFDAD